MTKSERKHKEPRCCGVCGTELTFKELMRGTTMCMCCERNADDRERSRLARRTEHTDEERR